MAKLKHRSSRIAHEERFHRKTPTYKYTMRKRNIAFHPKNSDVLTCFLIGCISLTSLGLAIRSGNSLRLSDLLRYISSNNNVNTTRNVFGSINLNLHSLRQHRNQIIIYRTTICGRQAWRNDKKRDQLQELRRECQVELLKIKIWFDASELRVGL